MGSTTPTLTEVEREILARFMAAGLELMGNGDFGGTIFGRNEPPGGDQDDRDEESGYLHTRAERDYVYEVFTKLFPGRGIYAGERTFNFNP